MKHKILITFILIVLDFEVETLINMHLHKAGFKIVEVPSYEHRCMFGASKLNTFRDGWRVLKTILRERSSNVAPLSQPQCVTSPFSVAVQPSTPEEIVL